MTADIIDLWLARRKLPRRRTSGCIYDPRTTHGMVNRQCPCDRCRAFFSGSYMPMQATIEEFHDKR